MIIGGIDIETTGLEQEKGHRIIEVALALHDEHGKELGSWATRVNPERPIDPEAQLIHGIAFEDLIACPTWAVVAPKLAALMGRCDYLVAHNGEGFDAPFIVRELMREGVSVPRIRMVDTLLQGRWATPDGMVPSLAKLAWACNVPYDKEAAHAALYDVQVMMKCFFHAYPLGFFQLPTHEFQLNKEAA